MNRPGIFTAADISCLIIPDGCLGLPTLAALEQGIPVIAVRDKSNILQNNLETLPWAPNQFYLVENYLEAIGVIAGIKAGVTMESVRRPLASAKVSIKTIEENNAEVFATPLLSTSSS